MTIKLCKDCAFCEMATNTLLAKCNHPHTLAVGINLVTGDDLVYYKTGPTWFVQDYSVYCTSGRHGSGFCGQDAEFWEPNEEFKNCIEQDLNQDRRENQQEERAEIESTRHEFHEEEIQR